MKINRLIKNVTPYSVDPIDVDIVLNANETKQYLFDTSFLNELDVSKYPDTSAVELRSALSEKFNVSPTMITVGNGSTQLLELTVRAFSEKGDTLVSFSPSFSMYDIYSQNQGALLKKVSILDDGTMPVNTMLDTIKREDPSIVFVCNPNNPTGSILSKRDVIKIVESTEALVVVDEAYMDFALEKESLIDCVNTYKNVLIARTFSKAYGLAGLRIGYMIGDPSLIDVINAIKLPYALNTYSQFIAKKALNKQGEVELFVKGIIQERQRVTSQLRVLGLDVYPSYANFIYLKSTRPLKQILLKKSILIRAFGKGFYRISIGTKDENDALISALEEVFR